MPSLFTAAISGEAAQARATSSMMITAASASGRVHVRGGNLRLGEVTDRLAEQLVLFERGISGKVCHQACW
jgi:hypothetical protein